jgi:hypothetical protein
MKSPVTNAHREVKKCSRLRSHEAREVDQDETGKVHRRAPKLLNRSQRFLEGEYPVSRETSAQESVTWERTGRKRAD